MKRLPSQKCVLNMILFVEIMMMDSFKSIVFASTIKISTEISVLKCGATCSRKLEILILYAICLFCTMINAHFNTCSVLQTQCPSTLHTVSETRTFFCSASVFCEIMLWPMRQHVLVFRRANQI